MLKYLFTGTGRHGSGYIHMVMNSVGIRCGHERIFNPWGGIYQKWPDELQADSSWMGVPYAWVSNIEHAIQIVRHPQYVIDSLVRIKFFEHPTPWRDFAVQHLRGIDLSRSPVENSAWFYVAWNKMAEGTCYGDIRHRIEDPVESLLGALEISYNPRTLYSDRTYNSRGDLSKTVDLKELPPWLLVALDDMCYDYGYELFNPPRRFV